ncbi:carbohydrate ABC transporter permease [Tessaracoccus defluvii]|uniref:Sugar ABC transporter permease n=1 Tax=Tessaracoccus defluvii TaxID=1285901 RepID=A0A7H0H2V5_9ACTN|nr:sugar ABC transporter permease [Tessaracoccus defluvii]QNP54871.1 sugar ABC transporter permease [Tessaracoccus defluvii]
MTTETLLREDPPTEVADPPRRRRRDIGGRFYPLWFYIPTVVLYVVLFAVPTFASFYFSLTRWTLFETEFIGLANFRQFFTEPMLLKGFINTFVYGFVTSGAKVVLGLALGMLLTSTILGRGYLRSTIFFPVLVSTVGVGVTFKVLMDPFDGLINETLRLVGINGPGWLTDPAWALMSIAMVDVWKGIGIATLIFIAGLVAIPQEYYEAARVDGATAWQRFRTITLPLVQPAMGTVILLSLISGLRSFDLIWAMTKGGPGFTSDVIGSVIYKQYQAGFYGLSTAGNVVLFIVVTVIILPISHLITKKQVEL